MKLILNLIATATLILSLSESVIAQKSDVDLLDLMNKDFKYIAKFTKESTAKEINQTVIFLQQYDPSIKITRTVDEITKKVTFEVSSSGVNCKSSDFGTAIILINKNNSCGCAIGDENAYIKPE